MRSLDTTPKSELTEEQRQANRDAAEAEDHLVEARANMLLGLPFFGSLALGLDLEPKPDIPTARTNGKVLQYNPGWINEELGFNDRRFLLAHEVAHCALKHHLRMLDRDPGIWNQAADYVVNQILIDSGFTAPDDLDTSRLWEFRDKTVEEIYDILYEEKPPDNPDGGGDSEGNEPQEGQQEGGGRPDGKPFGEIENPVKNNDPSDIKEQEQEWDQELERATQMAKRCGDESAGFKQILDKMEKKKTLDWKKELRNFVEKVTKGDYSWSTPNRRYAAMGIYLPALHSREIGKIFIAIDTSGSVGEAELKQFQAEINKIFSEFPCHLYICYCDSRIHRVDEYSPGDKIELEIIGRGGTDLRPPFDYVEENGLKIECMIYLTDMYGASPEKDPGYPTMWASTTPMKELDSGWGSSYKPKFGKYLEVQFQESD